MTNLSKERKRAEGKSVSAPVKSEAFQDNCARFAGLSL